MHARIYWKWLSCLLGLAALGGSLWSQTGNDLRISGQYEEANLDEVFQSWQADYGLLFSYRQELVDGVQVSAILDALPLEAALTKLLRHTKLQAEIRDQRFVLITPRELPLRLCGRLRDSLTGEPVAFANIRIDAMGRGAVSKANGAFVLSGSWIGQQKLSLSHLGYAPKEIVLTPTPGLCPIIKLAPRQMEIEGVAISEYLTDGISQGGQAIHLQPKRVSALPGLIEPDVFQMVQVLPGVNSPNGTATGLHIRGGTPDQTRVLYNDIPVYQTGHFFDMISAINPFAVEQAEVYRGGFSVAQPGGVSGLVQIGQGDQIPTAFSGGVQLNFTHAGAQMALPLKPGKVGLFLSARRSLTDIFPSPTFQRLQERVFQETRLGDQREDDELELERDIFNFWDGSARLLWHPDDKNQVEFSVFRGINNLNFEVREIEFDRNVEDILLIGNGGGSAKWTHQHSPTYRVETLLSLSEYVFEYDFEWVSLEDKREIESIYKSNGLQDLRFRHTHFHTWADRHQIQVGMESTWQSASLNFDLKWPGGEFQENILHSAFTQNLFGQYAYNINGPFSLISGIRLAYHSDLETVFAAPRMEIQYRPSPAWSVKAFAGRYHQFVSQLIEWDFDDLGIDNQIWTIAQDDLLPEVRSDQLGLGLMFKHISWLIDLEAYHKRIDNLTSLTPTLTSLPELAFEFGTATIWGMDLLIKKRWRHQRSWLSYTLGTIQYQFPELSSEIFWAPHDQRHQLRLNHLITHRNWEFALGWTLRSGKPYTPLDGQEVELFEEDDEAWWRVSPTYGPANSLRLPTFHRLDASAVYHFPLLQQKARGTIGLSVLNLYNRNNIQTVQYAPAYFDRDELPANPEVEFLIKDMLATVPNILLRIKW